MPNICNTGQNCKSISILTIEAALSVLQREKRMDMFDDNDVFIPVEMLMLLYTGEMIIRRVEHCTGSMQMKVLFQLVNEKMQTVFFCLHSCELR